MIKVKHVFVHSMSHFNILASVSISNRNGRNAQSSMQREKDQVHKGFVAYDYNVDRIYRYAETVK